MTQAYRVAILGATGAVGTELVRILEERQFPVAELKLLASERSAGQQIQFQGESLPVEPVESTSFKAIDLVLASAGATTSTHWTPQAVAAGAIVIDNSSAYRMQADVPLVVPEINPDALTQHHGIIANPNCSTILMCLAVYPLHRVKPVQRIVVATYQSAGGGGAKAIAELRQQAAAILQQQAPTTHVFPYPLAFNLFLHNTPYTAQGYCTEEVKMVEETRKIMGVPQLSITATCVRVPVFRAHSEAVNIEFADPFPVAEAQARLANAPGVKLVEDWQANHFPMPIEATGQDDVLVGRIRQDLSHPNCLELWLSGDQIRKGAALNAVQIAELLSK